MLCYLTGAGMRGNRHRVAYQSPLRYARPGDGKRPHTRSSFIGITGSAASSTRDSRSSARLKTVTASLRSLMDLAPIAISSFSLALSSWMKSYFYYIPP
jgi:hypothetical protein